MKNRVKIRYLLLLVLPSSLFLTERTTLSATAREWTEQAGRISATLSSSSHADSTRSVQIQALQAKPQNNLPASIHLRVAPVALKDAWTDFEHPWIVFQFDIPPRALPERLPGTVQIRGKPYPAFLKIREWSKPAPHALAKGRLERAMQATIEFTLPAQSGDLGGAWKIKIEGALEY